MGTVLAATVAVGGERLSADRADKIIKSSAMDEVEISVPPFVATCVTAEFLLFAPWYLSNRLSAAQAGLFKEHRSGPCKIISAAERFDRVLAYACHLADLLISVPASAVFRDSRSLFVCHFLYLRFLRRRTVIVIFFAFLPAKREKKAILPKRIERMGKLLESTAFFLYHGRHNIRWEGESALEEKEKAPDNTPELIKEIWKSVLGDSEAKDHDENRTD